MPDFATHHLFWELLELPAAAKKYPALTHWGLQGPDPLFYRKALLGKSPHHRAGNRMHEEQTNAFLCAMVAYCRHLHGDARERAEAYLFGFAGHYCLDAVAHPYVFFHQAQMLEKSPQKRAGVVHSQIENDIDMDIYGHQKHASACTLSPGEAYHLTPDEEKTLGALYTQLLYEVYQIFLPPGEVIASFRDMLFIQKLVFSGSRTILGLAGVLDTIAGPQHEYFSCRLKGSQPQWDSLNLAQSRWQNPWQDVESNESFPQLMARAAEKYRQLAVILERNLGGAALDIPTDVNFSGKPV